MGRVTRSDKADELLKREKCIRSIQSFFLQFYAHTICLGRIDRAKYL